MNFIFTCGGTAGHINPAVSIAEMLLRKAPDSNILFIGAAGMMEMDLVPKEGFEIKPITITNLSRGHHFSDIIHNIKTVCNAAKSLFSAARIIKDFKPDAVIGTGGYVCFPVITAAHFLGIPTFVHESNAVPGLTTRLLSSLVDVIFVGMTNSASFYKNPKKVFFTGTPVRTDFDLYEKDKVRSELKVDDNVPVILSVWGSLGSEYMNRIITEMIKNLQPGAFKLIHVTGTRYYEEYKHLADSELPVLKNKDAEIVEYLYDMPKMMVAADLVLCRAGASTISELTYLGKPAIIVPSPNVVNNHQEKNARLLEQSGAAKVLLEAEIDPVSFQKEVEQTVSDERAMKNMAGAMLAAGFKESSKLISDTVLSFINADKGEH